MSKEKNNSKSTEKKDRRDFIKKSALAFGAFHIFPSHVLFSKSEIKNKAGEIVQVASKVPSDRVNLACIGIGNRGEQVISDFDKTGLSNVVALCDVDMGAPHTKAILEKHSKAKRYKDFRELFDRNEVQFDAAVVCTPDFSHFPITMHAMASGKPVFVEKPMARTFQEVELMMKAAKKYGVITQMGNQGHSEANAFQFKSWVDAGIIKDVHTITCHMNSQRRWHGWDTSMTSYPKPDPIPETLDWDLWLTTAQHHEFNKDFANGQWRSWYEFGMGALGDWGAHIMDSFHRYLELGLPEEINAVKLDGHNPLFFPQATTLEFKFPKRGEMPPVNVSWYDGVDNLPSLPEGYGSSELSADIPAAGTGQIEKRSLNPGKIIYAKDLTFKGGSHGSTLSIIPEEAANDMKSRLPDVPQSTSNHFANFLLAVKGEEETRSPFDVAGPLSQIFSLGVLSQQMNADLKFDRDKKIITNNQKANELLNGTPPRRGWEEYYNL